jgi:hypothetical protein
MLRTVSFDVEGPVFRADMKLPSSFVQFDTRDAKPLAVAGCVPAVAQAPATSPSTAYPVCPPMPYYPRPPQSTNTIPATPYASGYVTPVPSYAPVPSGYTAPAATPPSPYAAAPGHYPLPAPQPPTLELADVVRLIEAGVDEQVIIRHTQKHRLAAPLTADDLILLTKSKATTKVITTLQEIPVAAKSEQPSKPKTETVPDKPAQPSHGAFDPYGSSQDGTRQPTPTTSAPPAAALTVSPYSR